FQNKSVQLGVLGFSLFEDRNVRVGILPQLKELLVSSSGFGGVAGECVGAAYLQMSDQMVREESGMVEKFLELACGCGTVSLRQIGLPAQIGGSRPKMKKNESQVVGSCRGKVLDGAGGVAALESNSGTNVGQIDEAYLCIFRKANRKVFGQPCGSCGVRGQGQYNRANAFNVFVGRQLQSLLGLAAR